MPRPVGLVLSGLDLEDQLADLGWEARSVATVAELPDAPDHTCAFVPAATVDAEGSLARPALLCAVGSEEELRRCGARADLYLLTPTSRGALVGVLRSAEALAEARAAIRAAPATLDVMGEGESALRDSHALLRLLVEAAADAIVVVDTGTALIVEANPAACALFGYSLPELRQKTGRALSPPSESVKIDALSASILERGAAQHGELEMWRKDGSRFWAWMRSQTFDVAGRSFYVNIIRDVSVSVAQRAQLERAHRVLEKSARLAALGELAATVAHEINNPLQFVSLNVAAMREPDRRDREEVFSDIDIGLTRIRRITEMLLPFARRSPPELELVDVPEAIRLALRIADNEIRHRAALVLDLGPVPGVVGYRERVEQLVTNLVLNAAQAVVEGNAPKNEIRVRTYAEEGWVVLEVEDTGPGISPDVQARMFESFFTTRQRMDGTGMGLAVAASIASELGGEIEYVQSPGVAGARFRVRLPAADELPAPEPVADPVAPVAPPTDSVRLLLVDDDPLVLRAYRRTLGRKHEVVVAASGQAALDVLGEDAAFDVILCDVMMPSMDGPQLYAEIAERYPRLATRVILCTGGTFTTRTLEFVNGVTARVLTKPVTLDDLDAAIAQLLRG